MQTTKREIAENKWRNMQERQDTPGVSPRTILSPEVNMLKPIGQIKTYNPFITAPNSTPLNSQTTSSVSAQQQNTSQPTKLNFWRA